MILYLKKDTGTDVLFSEIFKSTFFTQTLRVTTSGSTRRYLNDIKTTTIVTLMLALNVSLSFAITLEAAIENNQTKSWRFSREISLVVFCYNRNYSIVPWL